MSELKQKILEGIRVSGLSEWAFMVDDDCYGMVSYERLTDDDIDELATYILDEIIKQPTLNENQQIVLDWLKDYYKENRPFTTAFGAIRNVAFKRWVFIKQNLTEDQQEHVLEVFSRWALEQEAE